MLTPQNKTQNALLWLISFALSIVLAFLSALATQLPGNAPINWREVWLDVIQTILALSPILVAGLGLPRFGKEPLANLVNEVGPDKAKEVLEQVAYNNPQVINVQDINYGKLADEVIKKHAEETERIRSYQTDVRRYDVR